jgi:hypothetical protein
MGAEKKFSDYFLLIIRWICPHGCLYLDLFRILEETSKTKNKQMGLQPSSEQQQNFKAFAGIGECPSSTADKCSRKAHDRGSDSASNSN